MEYSVFINGGAEKELSRLQINIRKRIIVAILKIKNNPRSSSVRKLSGKDRRL